MLIYVPHPAHLSETAHRDLAREWTWSPAAFWVERRWSPFHGCSWRSCGSCSTGWSFWRLLHSPGCWPPRSGAGSALKQEIRPVRSEGRAHASALNHCLCLLWVKTAGKKVRSSAQIALKLRVHDVHARQPIYKSSPVKAPSF